MSHSTYAFEDLEFVITHPAMGQISVQGTGAGSITFNMADDVSVHDRAADGSVMTSKIKAGNGTVAISAQQTSDIHIWLTKLYNYLVAAPSNEWAQIAILATSNVMQVTHDCTNVSIQKRADKNYEAQGQQGTWNFLVAEMKEY